jgi:hypothetical protein
VDVAGGDARSLLNALELAVETTPPGADGEIAIVAGGRGRGGGGRRWGRWPMGWRRGRRWSVRRHSGRRRRHGCGAGVSGGAPGRRASGERRPPLRGRRIDPLHGWSPARPRRHGPGHGCGGPAPSA